MASVESNSPPISKEYRSKIIAFTALATLAFVIVMDKLGSAWRTSDYDARAKRSEALLTAGEQREQQYRDYFRGLEEDQKRTHSLIEAQERANARFQKVLDTWERQQREYQAYLDSLKRSSIKSNQSMKPTAPLRNEFNVFAATPCRGLSLSR